VADHIKHKDAWDKFGVLLQPVGSLPTTMAVAFLGVFGSRPRRRGRAIERAALPELMSQREVAESTLRKDVLGAILQEYLQASPSDLDAKVLQLELLSNNFHDSLDLRPLFHDLQRKLLKRPSPTSRSCWRIENLAREVTSKQLFTLQGRGARFSRPVDLTELDAVGEGSLALTPEPQTLTIGDHQCDIGVLLRSADRRTRNIRVRLEASACNGTDAQTLNTTFDVGFYDFPIIDNTRLPNGWRCAVALTNWVDDFAELTTIYSRRVREPARPSVLRGSDQKPAAVDAPPT
jgi:hypothetical protein